MMNAQPLAPTVRTRRIKLTCLDLLERAGLEGLTITDAHDAIIRGSSDISMITTRLMVADVLRACVAAGEVEARQETPPNARPGVSHAKRYWLQGNAPCL